jgi:iron complex outermembrane recepter protein
MLVRQGRNGIPKSENRRRLPAGETATTSLIPTLRAQECDAYGRVGARRAGRRADRARAPDAPRAASRRRCIPMAVALFVIRGTPLVAQQPPTAPAESQPLEEVIVTGSRLPALSDASISPVTTVSSGAIGATGLTRMEDVLNTLPMFFAGMTSNVSNGADGTAAVNLRGLGSQRTLVLVNGLRLGPGSADGRNWSDINQVPAALVTRVDVLTGGTSAVYGADAVAGVVNFVLNDHFEGLRLDAGYRFYEHGNSDQDGVAALVSAAGYPLPPSRVDTGFDKSASLLAGSDFAAHNANATVYVTYDNQAPVLQGQYDYSACNLSPQPESPPYTHLGCTGSGVSAGGEFFGISNGGATVLDDTVDPKTGLLRPYTGADLYNFGPGNYYLTPNVRWTAGTFVSAQLSPRAELYANLMYMRNSMSAQVAPGGDFYDYSFIPCADPLLTPQEAAALCSPAHLAALGGSEVYDGKVYPGVNLQIGRRNIEGGARIENFVNEMLRGVVGLKGTFGTAWTYHVHAQRGTTEIDDNLDNYFGNAALEQALNVLPGAGRAVCGGPVGSPANPLVGSAVAFVPNAQCIPWNIWVPGAVSASALESLYVPLQVSGSVTEQVVSGSVTADLGQYGLRLPSAQLGAQLNVGAEWREEQSAYNPNTQLQQGNISGFSAPVLPVAGAFTVREAFSEVRVPLASERFLARDLWLEAGLRESRYSSGFDSETYKLGFLWTPLRALSARGSYQRAVRAPDVGELYSPQSISADGSVDPCEGPSPTASLAACELSGVKQGQYGHIVPSPSGLYNGLQGGNSQLQPEVAHTFTLGLLIHPSEMPDLQVSADYFDIRISGVMGVIGADTILLNCLASVGDPQQAARFCPLIHRDAQGTLWLTPQGYVSDLEVNEGELATRGLDSELSYRVSLRGAGSVLLSVSGTRLRSLETTPLSGSGSYDCVGLFGATCGVAPKWRHVLNATWSVPWQDLQLGVRWLYLGGTTSEQTSGNPFLSGTPWLPLAHIPAYSYFDASALVSIAGQTTLRLGVNNIADKAPPLVVGGDCDEVYCNGNTFGGTYRSLGRYLFAQVTTRFGSKSP